MLNTPFTIQKHNINIGYEISISTYPIHGEDEKFLIQNADKARHHAVSVFSPELKLSYRMLVSQLYSLLRPSTF